MLWLGSRWPIAHKEKLTASPRFINAYLLYGAPSYKYQAGLNVTLISVICKSGPVKSLILFIKFAIRRKSTGSLIGIKALRIQAWFTVSQAPQEHVLMGHFESNFSEFSPCGEQIVILKCIVLLGSTELLCHDYFIAPFPRPPPPCSFFHFRPGGWVFWRHNLTRWEGYIFSWNTRLGGNFTAVLGQFWDWGRATGACLMLRNQFGLSRSRCCVGVNTGQPHFVLFNW